VFLPSPPTEANSDFAEGGEGGHGTNFIASWRDRGIIYYKTVMGAGAKVEDPPTGGDEIPSWRGKNRDELMNYTVRVRLSFIFFVRNQLRVYSIFQFVFGQRDLFDISNQPCS